MESLALLVVLILTSALALGVCAVVAVAIGRRVRNVFIRILLGVGSAGAAAVGGVMTWQRVGAPLNGFFVCCFVFGVFGVVQVSRSRENDPGTHSAATVFVSDENS